MSLKNLTVAKRLYLGFGLLLAILAAVTLVAIFKVHAINAALHANSDSHLLIQRAAINFRGSAHNRSIAIRDVVLAGTPRSGSTKNWTSTRWPISTPSRPGRWKR